MPRILPALFVFFVAVNAAAVGTISSLSPNSFKVNSGEQFITVNGSGLGDVLVFDGPAGHFEVDINAAFTGNVVGWVPEAIIARSGTYSLKVRGWDGDSNVATFTVVGYKYLPFVVLVPEHILQQALTRSGAYVKFDAVAFGGQSSTPTVKCDHDSGELFPMGETLVTCIASNTAGERAENSFPIIVGDWAPPVIKIPGAIRVKADSREGAYVKYDVTAYDDVYGEVKPLCSPESGSLFKVGTTRVDCSAEDFEGNPGSAVFDVEVVDGAQNALTLHVPDSFLYDADNPEGAYVNYDVTVSGTTDSRVDIKCDPPSGSLFPLKTTTVNCQAGDSLGQFAKASFDVTVADLGDPFIEKATVTPDLFAATGEYVPVSVDVSAVDTVDLKPSCQLYAISSNEKLSRGDATITGTYSATLRAAITEYEARIYRMHMSCSDYSGNKTLFTLYVTVSRDGKAPAPVTAQPTGGKRRASGH